MAIPDGKPATDFSAMNREWVRAVAEEAAESGGGIPAPDSPSDGDVLTYDSATSAWVAEAPSGGGIPAPENPSNGDVLTYDSATSAWVAEAPSGGGGDILYAQLTIDDQTSIGTLSKTWAEFKAAFDAHKIIYITSAYIGDSSSMAGDIYIPTSISEDHNGDDDIYYISVGQISFFTDSENGYPSFNFS